MHMAMLSEAQAAEGLKHITEHIARLNPKDVLALQLECSLNYEPRFEIGIAQLPQFAECTTTITIKHWQQMAKKKED